MFPSAFNPAANFGAGSSSTLLNALEFTVIILPALDVLIRVPPAIVSVAFSVIVTLPVSAATSN